MPIVHYGYVAIVYVEVDTSHVVVMFHCKPSKLTLVPTSCPVHSIHYNAMKRTFASGVQAGEHCGDRLALLQHERPCIVFRASVLVGYD